MLDFLNTVSGYVWGWPLMILLVGTGLWLTFSLRALQFSHLIHAFTLIVRKTPDRKAQGDISNFEALMVALSATVGTGNIAGVATAIYIGGPGALFWMWMTGLVGMATKYAEAVLAVKYRVQNENGTFSGGPMYYISRGLGWKWLATLFAFFAAIATFGIGSMVQSNSVADALNHSFSIAPGITGIVLMGLTAAVIIGGVRSIGRVTALLVPVMIALYVLGALAVILMHITEIPGVLAMVVSSAFQPVAATGGFAGNTVTPFDYGTCPCHAAVQRSRDLVSVQRAATLAQSDQTAVAVNRSSNIVWTGKAADLFRSRLSRTAQYSASLAQDMETTHRLAWGSS